MTGLANSMSKAGRNMVALHVTLKKQLLELNVRIAFKFLLRTCRLHVPVMLDPTEDFYQGKAQNNKFKFRRISNVQAQ